MATADIKATNHLDALKLFAEQIIQLMDCYSVVSQCSFSVLGMSRLVTSIRHLSGPRAGIAFDRRESKKSGRLIFWVSLGGRRYAAYELLKDLVELQVLVKAGKRKKYWCDSMTKGTFVRRCVDGDYLVLSINTNGNKKTVLNQMGKVLKETFREAPIARVPASLWRGLEYYERIKYGGEKYEDILEKKHPGKSEEIIKSHKEMRRKGSWHPKYREVVDNFNSAEAFISGKEFVRYALPGRLWDAEKGCCLPGKPSPVPIIGQLSPQAQEVWNSYPPSKEDLLTRVRIN